MLINMFTGDIDLHPNAIKALSEINKYILLLAVEAGMDIISILLILRLHKVELCYGGFKRRNESS